MQALKAGRLRSCRRSFGRAFAHTHLLHLPLTPLALTLPHGRFGAEHYFDCTGAALYWNSQVAAAAEELQRAAFGE